MMTWLKKIPLLLTVLGSLLMVTSDVIAKNACLDIFPQARHPYSASLDLPFEPINFKTGTDIAYYDWNDQETLSLTAGHYGDIQVPSGKILEFSSPDALYYIRSLWLENGAVVRFNSGDYRIGSVYLGSDAKLRVPQVVIGTQLKTTRLYIDAGRVPYDPYDPYNQQTSGEFRMMPNALVTGLKNLIVVTKSAYFEFNTSFSGVLFVRGTSDLRGGITGAVAALGAIPTVWGANYSYRADTIKSIDFNGMCQVSKIPATLLHHYTFDDDWATTKLLKDLGPNPRSGTVSGNVSRIASPASGDFKGDTCYAADFRGGTIEFNNMTPATKFGDKTSLSFWVYWDGSNDDVVISWNKHDLWFGKYKFGFNTWSNDNYGTNSSSFLQGWHHVAAVFVNGYFYAPTLYINGNKKQLSSAYNRRSNEHIAYAGSTMNISGYSGGTGYRFSGSIDNLKIYNGEITQSQINADINENCAEPEAILEWHLDELSWQENTNGEIIDQSGNLNHGEVVDWFEQSLSTGHVTNVTDGQICRAGTVVNDGSTVNTYALDTRVAPSNKGAISFWYRSNDRWLTGNQHTLFDASSAINNSPDPYFFLRKRMDGGIDFWIEDSNDTDFQYYSRPLTIADNTWVHVVASWDLAMGSIALHINGEPVPLIAGNKDIAINSGMLGNLWSLYFGDTRSSYILRPNDLNTANGQFDEIVIFDRTLTNEHIKEVYENQSQQLTWDGDPRHCEAVLDVRFDQSGWDSTGAVIDSSQYNHHGTASNVLAAPGVGDMCYAPVLDGYNHLDFANRSKLEVGKNNQDFTVSYWIKADVNQLGGYTSVIHKGHINYERTFSSWLHWSEKIPHVALSTESRDNNAINGDIFPGEQWLHITLLKNNHRFSLFMNGEEVKAIDLTSDTRSNSGPIVIGKSFTYYSMKGQFDELVVFSEAKSAKFIKQIYNNNLNKLNWDGTQKSGCQPLVNHYRLILNDNDGLTCEAEPMTIKACTNDSCSTTYNKLASVVMTPSSGWPQSNTINFTNKTTSLTYKKTSIGNVVYNMSLGFPDAPFRCYVGSSLVSGAACTTRFKEAGFKFSYGNSNNITAQRAGEIFPQPLKIQAVKDVNGVCRGLFNGPVTVGLAQQGVSPSNISTLEFKVGLQNIAKNASAVNAYQNVTLNFDAQSQAVIPNPLYQDAGLIGLHAKYNLNGVVLTGSSNQFWVKPFILFPQVNQQVTDIFKAGYDFGFKVSALNKKNNLTPNYRPGQLQLSVVRSAPLIAGTGDGQFEYAAGLTKKSAIATNFSNVNLTSFVGGASTYHQSQYSEVGRLTLGIQDVNYGNQNLVVTGLRQDTARFIPDRFELTVSNGRLQGHNNKPFAYVGEKTSLTNNIGALSYGVRPSISILPVNKQGVTTQNYIGDYNKLLVSGINLATPAADALKNGRDNLTKMVLTANLSVGDLSAKTMPVPLIYQLAANDHFYYDRDSNSMINPFDSKINIAINSIVDTDGVKVDVPPLIKPQGIKIRYGRTMLSNTYGPETSQLNMPLAVQYFKDGLFKINDDDNNNFDNNYKYRAIDLLFSPLGALTPTALNSTNRSVVNGLGSFVLKAPGVGQTGSRVITMPTPSWLKFDWDGNAATGLQNPFATATFGRYRGNDRLIYWREVK